MKQVGLLIVGGLSLLALGGRLWADSFRQIGGARPSSAYLSAAPGGDPDANLPTEDMRPHPAVVRIIVPERGMTSYGSGTLVDVRGKHGLVVTNWHVVSDAVHAPTVLFADGFRSLAQVVKTDRDWDLAALVIWRPPVEPVSLAVQPPRPGEMLAIAGYGQGPYRIASGRCTKYQQPRPRLPAEWLEVAVAARQGDSGGPIFNQQGALAGVLWGEGNGFTMGSYCGRVRRFLSGVLPEAPADERQLVAVPSRQVARQVSGTLDSASGPAMKSNTGSSSLPRASAIDTTLSRRPEVALTSYDSSQWPATAAPSQSLDWPAWFGKTRPEQGKTILAIFGALAIAARIRRSILNTNARE